MDIKKLISKMDMLEGSMQQAEHNPTGPKFTGYWRGTDPRTPGTHMVGGAEQQESILQDLQRGPTPRSRAEELAEEYAAFLQALEEEHLGVTPKRAHRQGSRPERGHEPQSGYRYHNKKVDEQMPGSMSSNVSTGSSTVTPQQAAATNQAVQTLKAATQSPAATTNIAKALDAASKGSPVSATDMKVLQPMMQDITTIAQNPKFASQFQSLAAQVNLAQKKT